MKREKGTITTKICFKIKFERMKRNLSQEDLALAAGISNIESGKASPTIDTLEKIANALGIAFLDLVDVSKVDL